MFNIKSKHICAHVGDTIKQGSAYSNAVVIRSVLCMMYTLLYLSPCPPLDR